MSRTENLTENLYETLTDFLSNLSNDDLIEIHNNYCDENNDPDSRIYYMVDIDDLFSDMPVSEALDTFSEVDIHDEYLYFNSYYWKSGDSQDVLDDMIFLSDIAEYIIDTEDALGNDEVQEFLDKVHDFDIEVDDLDNLTVDDLDDLTEEDLKEKDN